MSDKIPETDSIQELAEFWDTHDLTDYESELEEIHEPVFERETVLQLHLSAEEAQLVRRIAQARGMDSGHLIREWISEKVHSAS